MRIVWVENLMELQHNCVHIVAQSNNNVYIYSILLLPDTVPDAGYDYRSFRKKYTAIFQILGHLQVFGSYFIKLYRL